MGITAIYGIVFAVIAAFLGASFSRRHALGIGASIALTIGAVALWSWYETPDHAHWTQAIAILLMAAAARFGALFRRPDYGTANLSAAQDQPSKYPSIATGVRDLFQSATKVTLMWDYGTSLVTLRFIVGGRSPNPAILSLG